MKCFMHLFLCAVFPLKKYKRHSNVNTKHYMKSLIAQNSHRKITITPYAVPNYVQHTTSTFPLRFKFLCRRSLGASQSGTASFRFRFRLKVGFEPQRSQCT